MKIYLLTGTSGEYSARSNWNVRAFVARSGAETLSARLDEIENRKRALRSDGDYDGANALDKEVEAIDPNGTGHWDATDYAIEEIELEGGAE